MRKRVVLRIISGMLALVVLIGLVPSMNVAADTISYGTTSDGFHYKINNGEAIITGYAGNDTYSVVMPDMIEGYPVTEIGDYAFANSYAPWRISETIRIIGTGAYYNCSNDAINIPSNVQIIEENAFYGCSLNSIYFAGAKEDWIEISIESGNNSLYGAEIYFDSKSTSDGFRYKIIDGKAIITGYKGLSNDVVIPSKIENYPVTEIGDYAFMYSSDSFIFILTEGIKKIGVGAFFYGCSSNDVIDIPSTVTTIEDYAFYGCGGLNHVYYSGTYSQLSKIFIGEGNDYFLFLVENETIPNAISNEFDYIISDSQVTITNHKISASEVVIPEKIEGYPVTSIGNDAFDGCSNLESVTIPEGVTSIGNYAFYDCFSLTSVTIPDGVTSIGMCAFDGCSNLESITIPEGVTSIDDWTFANCGNLTSITIPEGVTSIGVNAFDGCVSLESVTIPSSVTRIEVDAFIFCTSLESVTIPPSVTSIDSFAFAYCDSLKSVTIPEEVNSIDDGAFRDCTSLTDVYYSGTEEQWNDIAIGELNECLTNATIHCMQDSSKDEFAISEEEGADFDSVNGTAIGYIGDADASGSITIKDATAIQKHIASIVTIEGDLLTLADVDVSGSVNVRDAKAIQKWLADISDDLPIYHLLYIPSDNSGENGDDDIAGDYDLTVMCYNVGRWYDYCNYTDILNDTFLPDGTDTTPYDIVAFQEYDTTHKLNDSSLPGKYLCGEDLRVSSSSTQGVIGGLEGIGFWQHMAVGAPTVGDNYTKAVASKYPISNLTTTWYNNQEGEKRTYDKMTVQIDSKEVIVYNTHLTISNPYNQSAYKVAQAKELAADFQREVEAGKYCIVFGDFNTRCDKVYEQNNTSTIVNSFIGCTFNSQTSYAANCNGCMCCGNCSDFKESEEGLVSTCSHGNHSYYTYSKSSEGTFHTDNIFTSPNIEIVSVEMDTTKDNNYMYGKEIDHRPLIAYLKFR